MQRRAGVYDGSSSSSSGCGATTRCSVWSTPATSRSSSSGSQDRDEIEYVIEGEVEFLVDGTWTRGGPGTVQLLPAGAAHSVRVPAGSATVLMVTVGPPYDGFARDSAALAHAGEGYPDPVALLEVATRHGLRLA